MSIMADLLDPARAQRTEQQRLEELAKASSVIAAAFGLNADELGDALAEAVRKKTLAKTESDLARIRESGAQL